MARRAAQIQPRLAALDELLGGLAVSRSIAEAIVRWRAGAGALQFHLQAKGAIPAVVVLGGTGTGKSTLVNRLLNSNVTTASFKRTFTAGAIAIAAERSSVPERFLGLGHSVATEIPARGEPEKLAIIQQRCDLTERATLIDTPDLDGDQPAHHAQADRAFRWAQAVVFLVTPEKYQMPELLPYYRLAQRYAVPALFVMNKVEEQAPVDDYTEQLAAQGYEHPRVFAIARDDATFQPAEDANLVALGQALQNLQSPPDQQRAAGIANRSADLLDRLQDQILLPLERERGEADRLIDSLHAMEAPQPGVDVNPLTRQLARRLQQRSILYLMGPQRILDRVRQVPGLLVRLPRTAWDWMITGKANLAALNEIAGGDGRQVPDFQAALMDQFGVLQTRIEDTLRCLGDGAALARRACGGLSPGKARSRAGRRHRRGRTGRSERVAEQALERHAAGYRPLAQADSPPPRRREADAMV